MISTHVSKFLIAVILPLTLAVVGVAALAVKLTLFDSAVADLQEHEYDKLIVEAAVAGAKRELANMVAELSRSRDTARHLYGTADLHWMLARYGQATVEGINYDAMLVLERGSPVAVAGLRRGAYFNPDLQGYFGGKLVQLLDELPENGGMLLNTQDGLAFAATGPVLKPHTPLQPWARPRYLMALRYLTPARVEALGGNYAVKGLAIKPLTTAGPAQELLRDFTGGPVAAMTWTDRHPGDVLVDSVWFRAIAAVGFASVFMLGVGLPSWRLIRALAQGEATARHRSLRDPLTGLANRAALHAEIRRLSAQPGAAFAIAFIDLDGFKQINDTYNHETGDALIKAVAELLFSLGLDAAFRLGGDEFVLLQSGPDARNLMHRSAGELLERLRSPFLLNGKVARVGASIGIAVAHPGIEAAELMRQADAAMYAAKHEGKNCIREYERAFDSGREENLAVVKELRRIVAEGSVDIAYQPIVDSSGARIVGVEALARCPESASQSIDSASLIRAIELNGFIDELGAAVLAKACAAASAWPDLRLAVNVSPAQLRNPGFVADTLRIIAENGMTPGRVELEIPANELLHDMAARRALPALRQAGIGVCLDNFGGADSCIGALTQFEFDSVKVDRALIASASATKSHCGIIRGIITAAQALSGEVTANGVENEEHLDLLRQAGCGRMQGYHFYKPMPAPEITALLRSS